MNSSTTPPLRHLGICPDGNGRWASQRGLPRHQGHIQGARAVWPILDACVDLGISHLSLYVFSSENWRREEEEVQGLLNLIAGGWYDRLDAMQELGVKMSWAGRRDRVPLNIREQLEFIEKATAANQSLTLIYCTDYGGRDELSYAAQAAARDVQSGNLDLEELPARFADYLSQPGLPDMDLFIRTSGEQRISNFMLWHMAYSELMFSDVLWPDFEPRHLQQMLDEYAQRDRRFGAARHGAPEETQKALTSPSRDSRWPES
ncbi:polyprenyl diphosphate synthase [Kineococcus endophyticus]|uniref:Isoprenyl transferase n=1 Tax=Kineococcus endophyticus TaxID=1181883 RepID=A0ABV3PDW5_9ACTN